MFSQLKRKLLAFHRDERGAMSVEKILIIAIISIPLITVLFIFRGKIVEWFQTKTNDVTTQQNTPPNYN